MTGSRHAQEIIISVYCVLNCSYFSLTDSSLVLHILSYFTWFCAGIIASLCQALYYRKSLFSLQLPEVKIFGA